MSIPASAIVTIIPSVISGGGSALAMNGLMLTGDTAVAIGSIRQFASLADVGLFFGAASSEYSLAGVYFGAYKGATLLPANLMFAQYNTVAVAGYMRGGKISGLTLAQLQALTGVLTLSVDGVSKTSAAIVLTAATSFSNAATIIQAAFTALGATVTYDAQRGAFLFTSSTTDVLSLVTVATGTLSAGLLLTTATGAITSAGAATAVPTTLMNSIIAQNLNWAAFMCVTAPSDALKLEFAAWTNTQNNRFMYVLITTDAAAKVVPDTTTVMASVKTAGYSGIVGIFNDVKHAAFVLGVTASINWNAANARITYAFRYQAGLIASVTNQSDAAALDANGYNYIGEYATANDGFTFLYKGQISGVFKFIDAYVNQIFMNSQFQVALVGLLTNMNSIPYNDQGNAVIAAACQAPINQMLNFGGIVTGVALSDAQAAQVNAQAGKTIDKTLATRGWYLLIGTPTSQQRAARQSPPMSFFYVDGGAVQQINMPSILVQ
jgi:hypothetical protein